jgi:hypothetical protein
VLGVLAPQEAAATTIDFTTQQGKAIRKTGVFDDPTMGQVTFIAGPSGSTFSWVDGGGLGVRCQGSAMCFRDTSTAVNAFETIRIEFATPVNLGYITLNDFWSVRSGLVVDVGTISGSTFSATLTGVSHGMMTQVFNQDVTWIELRTPNSWNYQFQLARIQFSTPTPEPSASILFGLGLLTVVYATRRRAA